MEVESFIHFGTYRIHVGNDMSPLLHCIHLLNVLLNYIGIFVYRFFVRFISLTHIAQQKSLQIRTNMELCLNRKTDSSTLFVNVPLQCRQVRLYVKTEFHISPYL